jgi:hypothetical protein
VKFLTFSLIPPELMGSSKFRFNHEFVHRCG